MSDAVHDTLDWCNEIRSDRGLAPLSDLPKGKRYDPKSCPCGTATGVWVSRHTWATSKEAGDAGETYPLPAAVTMFTIAFDGGELPQYEAT